MGMLRLFWLGSLGALSTLELDVAVRAARAAAAIHRDLKGSDLQVRTKSTDIDLVTLADTASEAAIVEILLDAFPQDAILGEEEGQRHGNSQRRWIVDPLDGTLNYAHGFPWYCVSIALEVEGVIEVGVVLDSVHNELFTAQRGAGAHLNGDVIVPGANGSDLGGSDHPDGARANDADVVAFHRAEVRLEGQDGLCTGKAHCDPARAIVAPLSVEHIGTIDLKDQADTGDVSFISGTTADEIGGCERQPPICLTKVDEANPALLHDDSFSRRDAPSFEPSVAGADGWMAGERELGPGREDADPVVGRSICWLQDERGLAQVRPMSELLHLFIGEIVGIKHDCYRITAVRNGGEYINLLERTHPRTVLRNA